MLSSISRNDKIFYATAGLFMMTAISVVLFNYDHLPERIPVFLDLAGNISSSTSKNYFSILRLPLMSIVSFLLISGAHIASAGLKNASRSVGLFWKGLLIFLVLKMALSNISIIFLTPNGFTLTGLLIHYFSTLIAFLGAIIMGHAFVQAYRSDKNFMKAMLIKLTTGQKYFFTILIFVYIILVFIPKTVG